jgi:hypothetical protein
MAPVLDTEKMLHELFAKQQIYEVLVRYCRGVDRLDKDIILSVYHPGANDDHGGFNGPVEQFVDWVFGNHKGKIEACTHFLGNVLIEVDGDTAYSESYIIAYHRKTADRITNDLAGWGRCLDRFEKRDGEWRIADRVVVYDKGRTDRMEADWGGAMTQDLVRGTRNRADPSYKFVSRDLPVGDS